MGITLGSNFTVNTALPLDDRMVVADIAARNAIPSGRRFQGMIVHVLSDLKNYQLQGGILDGNFVDISTVTPPVVNVPFVGSSLVNIYNKTLSDLASCKTTVGTRPSGLNSGIGSPLLTAAWTQTDVGTNQLTITKASGNAQGENIRFSIPVYQTNYGKVITVQFDFSVTANYIKPGSGTDGSLIMYLEYGDGVINTFQQLSVVQIEAPTESNNLTARYRGEFQYIVDATKSYWLMFYCPRTETTTWTAYVRNLEIRPAQYVYGTPITDPVSYTPTFTGFGTAASINVSSWKDGAYVFGEGTFIAGTTTATQAQITMGYGGANANVTSLSTISASLVVVGKWSSSTTNQQGVVLAGPSRNYLVLGLESSATNGLAVINGSAITTGSVVSFNFRVPIQGWSSSVQTSDQTDTRIVDFYGQKNAGESVTANTTNISFVTGKDSHGAWNGTQYTVPVAGDYLVSCVLNVASGSNISIYKNGVAGPNLTGSSGSSYSGGSTIVSDLRAGDVLSIRSNSSLTVQTGTNFSISRLSGPSAIAASETIAARYYVSAGASTTNTNPINFDTKDFDTHGAVTTGAGVWKFTAPISGIYRVSALIYYGATGNNLILYKNGSSATAIISNSLANTAGIPGFTTIRLNAGDYIAGYPGTTVTPTAIGSVAATNFICIERVGN